MSRRQNTGATVRQRQPEAVREQKERIFSSLPVLPKKNELAVQTKEKQIQEDADRVVEEEEVEDLQLVTASSVELESPVEERSLVKAENSARVSNWMIAIGVAATVAVVTAGTVYYVKQKRKRELTRASYLMGEEEEPTVESYTEKFNKYWNLTTNIFGSVKTSILSILGKPKTVTPFVSAEQARDGMTLRDDEEADVLLQGEL